MTALIISGGDFASLPEGFSAEGAYVIACDRGYQHARKLGIEPDLILGDFDSAPVPSSGNVEKYPSHKDDTDTMLAVRHALSRGCTDLVIACAFGGRLDHTIANIQAGAFVSARGGTAHLVGETEEAWIFSGREMAFPRRGNRSLSVFSLTDTSEVSISGAEYECQRLTLHSTFPVGISNEWKQATAIVSAHDGIVMVMNSHLSM